jgi:hypothetical protein
MNDTPQKHKDDFVACEICLKEIPVSEAKSEEASGYVAHFADWNAMPYGKHSSRRIMNK